MSPTPAQYPRDFAPVLAILRRMEGSVTVNYNAVFYWSSTSVVRDGQKSCDILAGRVG